MSDLIDRQKVIETMCEACNEEFPDNPCEPPDCKFVERIKALPSVQNEYSEIEKKFLSFLFDVADIIINFQGGYMEIDYESFGRGDLYNLSEKIGVDY